MRTLVHQLLCASLLLQKQAQRSSISADNVHVQLFVGAAVPTILQACRVVPAGGISASSSGSSLHTPRTDSSVNPSGVMSVSTGMGTHCVIRLLVEPVSEYPVSAATLQREVVSLIFLLLTGGQSMPAALQDQINAAKGLSPTHSDLLHSLLHDSPAYEALAHPFFWSRDRVLHMLVLVAERLLLPGASTNAFTQALSNIYAKNPPQRSQVDERGWRSAVSDALTELTLSPAETVQLNSVCTAHAQCKPVLELLCQLRHWLQYVVRNVLAPSARSSHRLPRIFTLLGLAWPLPADREFKFAFEQDTALVQSLSTALGTFITSLFPRLALSVYQALKVSWRDLDPLIFMPFFVHAGDAAAAPGAVLSGGIGTLTFPSVSLTVNPVPGTSARQLQHILAAPAAVPSAYSLASSPAVFSLLHRAPPSVPATIGSNSIMAGSIGAVPHVSFAYDASMPSNNSTLEAGAASSGAVQDSVPSSS